MKPTSNHQAAHDYLAVRLAARRHGHRIGSRDGELLALLYDFGAAPIAHEVRTARRSQAESKDPYSVPFEERAAKMWSTSTRDLVLSALTSCPLSNRRVRVDLAEQAGVEGWLIRVHPAWVASVHARGVAVVNGRLTLTARHYPHALPDGASAYCASWIVPRLDGLTLADGVLYRPSTHAEWQHAKTERSAFDRLLDNAPRLLVPKRELRTQNPERQLLRTAFTDAELGQLKAAAYKEEESLSEWARRVLLHAAQGRRIIRRRLGTLYLADGGAVVTATSAIEKGLALAAGDDAQHVSTARKRIGGVNFDVKEGPHTVFQIGERIVIRRVRHP